MNDFLAVYLVFASFTGKKRSIKLYYEKNCGRKLASKVPIAYIIHLLRKILGSKTSQAYFGKKIFSSYLKN